MAASFLAMNEVHGQHFAVDTREVFESAVHAKNAPPKDLFVLDDQLHMVRSSLEWFLYFRAYAQGATAAELSSFKSNPFNPGKTLPDEFGEVWAVLNRNLVGKKISGTDLHLLNFIKEVFLDSQVTVGLLSASTLSFGIDGKLPDRFPRNVSESQRTVSMTAAQTVAVRNFVNELSGSRRMLAHGQFYPGRANLSFMEDQIARNKPDSWKGYCIAAVAKLDSNPESEMQRWRLDNEDIVYPTYDLITKHKEQLADHPGFWNICIHKGFSASPIDAPELGNPTDIPKAAKDWPHLNFIIYHACFGGMTAFGWHTPVLNNIRGGVMRNGVPDIPWLTQFGQTCGHLPNVYAEIGSTFATTVTTFPTVCAHLMGQLLKYFGPDRIVFGSDCTYYGSPQWQIEALWRFQIPEAMRKQYGYPALDESAKRKILGLNSARIYKLPTSTVSTGSDYRAVPPNFEASIPKDLKTLLEFPGYAKDAISQARDAYREAGGFSSNTRHGWVRRA